MTRACMAYADAVLLSFVVRRIYFNQWPYGSSMAIDITKMETRRHFYSMLEAWPATYKIAKPKE